MGKNRSSATKPKFSMGELVIVDYLPVSSRTAFDRRVPFVVIAKESRDIYTLRRLTVEPDRVTYLVAHVSNMRYWKPGAEKDCGRPPECKETDKIHSERSDNGNVEQNVRCKRAGLVKQMEDYVYY